MEVEEVEDAVVELCEEVAVADASSEVAFAPDVSQRSS